MNDKLWDHSVWASGWIPPPHRCILSTFIFLFKITSDVLSVNVGVRFACVCVCVCGYSCPLLLLPFSCRWREERSTEENQEQEVGRKTFPDMATENSFSVNWTCVLFLGLFLQMLACEAHVTVLNDFVFVCFDLATNPRRLHWRQRGSHHKLILHLWEDADDLLHKNCTN